MAGGETPETPASAEGGEKLSKNEQKRREKQAKAAAAKAEKAAAKAPVTDKRARAILGNVAERLGAALAYEREIANALRWCAE